MFVLDHLASLPKKKKDWGQQKWAKKWIGISSKREGKIGTLGREEDG